MQKYFHFSVTKTDTTTDNLVLGDHFQKRKLKFNVFPIISFKFLFIFIYFQSKVTQMQFSIDELFPLHSPSHQLIYLLF